MDARYSSNAFVLKKLEDLYTQIRQLIQIVLNNKDYQNNQKPKDHEIYYKELMHIVFALEELMSAPENCTIIYWSSYDTYRAILHSIATQFFNILTYDLSEKYYYKEIDVLLKNQNTDLNKRLRAEAYINLADCYLHLQNTNLAVTAVLNAVKVHATIKRPTANEAKLASTNEMSLDYLIQFRMFYDRKNSQQCYLDSGFMYVTNLLLKKLYDPTLILCEDIKKLVVNNHTMINLNDVDALSAVFAKTSLGDHSTSSKFLMQDSEYLKIALLYQEVVNEINQMPNKDLKAIKAMIEAATLGLRSLQQIKAPQLLPQDAYQFASSMLNAQLNELNKVLAMTLATNAAPVQATTQSNWQPNLFAGQAPVVQQNVNAMDTDCNMNVDTQGNHM